MAAVVVVFVLWQFLGGDASDPADTPVAISTATEDPSARAAPGSPGPSTPVPSDARWPVTFEGDTGTVLLFDGGGDGAVAVDLDTGAAVDVNLPGRRADDQPFRLHRMGGWVIVGWDEVFAVPVGRDRTTRQLGDGVVFLPAAEPDSLWLVDQPGEATAEPSTWRLVDLSGQVQFEAEGTEEPLRGVPRGLALRRSDGSLARFDLVSQQVVDYLEPDARIADVNGNRVVWCDEPCDQLHVADGDGETVATIGTERETFHPDGAWLSPDGSRLVAHVRFEVGDGVGLRIRMYDVRAETLIADAQLRLGGVHGSWTLDGDQFFYWLNAGVEGQGAPLEVGRWSGRQFEQVDVAPHGSHLRGFVALPRHNVTSLFTQAPSDL